jgi:broad specificity phosphatase PhoE
MKTTIYLVRHGEVYNPKRVVYGRMPGFPLSENGILQAHKLGKHLSARKIHAIYSSPLTRAEETAEIISSYHKGVPVTHENLLLEVHSPQFEGTSFDEAEKLQWNFYQEKYYPLGQERVEEVCDRMTRALRVIARKHIGKEIVAVSHADPIMITLLQYQGLPLLSSEIDRNNYVPTANGFRLVFDESGAVEVSKLVF